MSGLPSPPLAVKSGSVNSVPPDSGAPVALGPADEALLLAERGAVPRLDAHPDPPRDEERAAGEPRGGGGQLVGVGTQTCSSRSAVSSALTLAVPSLNPNRLRGVSWAVLVDEVRP